MTYREAFNRGLEAGLHHPPIEREDASPCWAEMRPATAAKSALFSMNETERRWLALWMESYGPAEVLAQLVSVASAKAEQVRLHFPHQAKAWDETATRLAAIVPGICATHG